MECPHCGVEALMGAATCVSCGESMFSLPGGAAATRRPATNPAPWRDTGHDSAPSLEPRRFAVEREDPASETASPAPAEPAPALPPPPARRPSFVADDGPGSSSFQKQWQRETVSEFPRPGAAGSGGVGEPPASSDAAGGSTPSDLPAMPAAVSLPRRGRRSICTICFGPKNDALADLCDECEERSSGSYNAATGRATMRVRPTVKRTRGLVRRTIAALFWGTVLVGSGLGVVHYMDRPTPGAALLKGAHTEATAVGCAIPDMGATDFRTEFDVRLVREEHPTKLATGIPPVFDLRQIAAHASRMTLLESRAGTAVLNVRTETKLERQDGEFVDEMNLPVEVYPWDGHLQVSRLKAPARGSVTFADGRAPIPARDVPPFLTFGVTRAPEGALTPGSDWEAAVDLPCVAGLDGKLAPYPFTCEFEYVGRRVIDGRSCAVVRVSARPEGEIGGRLRDLESAGGSVAGALAFDVGTGLLVSADLTVDTHVIRGSAEEPDERVRVVGTLKISRAQL